MAKLTHVPSIPPKAKSFTAINNNKENYGICFQFYKSNFQHTTLGSLKPKELKAFEKLIEEVVKCTSEDEFSRIHRGKNKRKKKGKLYNYEAHKELIHIGKNGTSFRLHGILRGKIFKIVSIDPKHQEHKC